ncbi:MAG: EAL domain-containing protein, partial [Desulfuromonadales bacterium]|nr:EAL domain-containing protein [Desulfuromonadales bacterium]
ELKIDKSFVLNLMEEESDRKIVKAVIGLAHDLSLKVVAEGIETVEALTELERLGCDIGQGY